MQDAKRRALIFLVMALALAAIAGFLFLQKVSAVDARLGDRATVWVAKQTIPPREPLKAQYFEAMKVPEQFVQDSIVTDLKAVEMGEYTYSIDQLISVAPMSEGDVLTDNVLKTKSFLSSENKRMVTLVRSDRLRFDGSLDINDHVDIIVSEEGKGTYTFLKDVPIVGMTEDGSGIGVEVSLKEAEKLIDKENFAISIRVLKAPSEQSKGSSGQSPKQTLPNQNPSPNANDKDEQPVQNGGNQKEGDGTAPSQ
ncbi:hypothetical protein [Melghirimyces thermohalophilus]|nr:hypothetical protein [Melghirimyces thermohalophilus]